jgi:hypothetical protein
MLLAMVLVFFFSFLSYFYLFICSILSPFGFSPLISYLLNKDLGHRRFHSISHGTCFFFFFFPLLVLFLFIYLFHLVPFWFLAPY